MSGKTTIVNEHGVSADVNSSNELKVALSSDVQIGAVEIKDGESDVRGKVKTDGVDNAQVVTQNSQPLPTGASTSAKQLLNDHDVNVSNMIPAVETGNGSDGTNTWVTVNMTFTEPIILKYENEDEMSLTVNDDLTGLLELKVGASCKVEDRYIVDECVPK